MEKYSHFNSGEEMLDAIYKCDLYSPNLGLYVFHYNSRGAITYYHIDIEEAKELEKLSQENGEYWSAFLGVGGYICDDPSDEYFPPNEGCSNIDFCNDLFKEKWILTDDVISNERC